jgi:hypothetical protein
MCPMARNGLLPTRERVSAANTEQPGASVDEEYVEGNECDHNSHISPAMRVRHVERGANTL